MLFRDAPSAIRNVGIDILLVDQVTGAGGTIADYLQLPFITICNALPIQQEPSVPPYFTSWEYSDTRLARLRNRLGYRLVNFFTRELWDTFVQQRKQWNLPPHAQRSDSYSGLAQIAQLPQELDFPRKQLVPWFHYAGPLKNPLEIEPVSLDQQHFSFDSLSNKPLIYANLGTLQSHNWKIFHAIAEACLGIDAQLVISLGNPKADPSQTNFPGNPLVVPFPPHQQLINRAELVITHAGSTAVSCLSSGVPMVAIPITTDQPGMAARVKRVGAGEVVPLKKLSVSHLRTAIQQVLGDRAYRENAARLQTAIQAAGGVNYAADVIEQVIRTQAPALNPRLQPS
ncbi:glycosyltransferase [Geitlerinema sp. PCC 7407]|uniref:glycosyltransferase n=1 Tax=Geitlerinema sp. PCC 7407 TaxID=1173025 RepID=UPI0037C19BE2